MDSIAIVMPTGATVQAATAMCLANLVGHMAPRGYPLMLINPQSSLIQKGRYDGVCQALEAEADYIMFIDSDMTFPPSGVVQLLAHDLPVVGATYRLRQDEKEYVARLFVGDRWDCLPADETLVYASTNGLGFNLIKTDVFNKIPEPWFKVRQEGPRWVSEDESFFQGCATANIPCVIDCALSLKIGHIGSKTYES